MNDDRRLDCVIYVDTATLEELVPTVAGLVGGQGNRQPGGWVVHCAVGEIDIRRNPDADCNKASIQPDGFLYARAKMEFYPRPGSAHEQRIVAITTLLNGLWTQGLPAVAACDYEAELPRRGGYSADPLPQTTSQPVA